MRNLRHISRAARRFGASERGTQLVELAIVLPLLLVMFGATTEFGRFFYTYHTLTKGTRAAARFLTTAPIGGQTDAQAQNLVVYGNKAGTGSPIISGLTVEHVVISREGGTPVMPERVRVAVSGFTYQPIFGLVNLAGDGRALLNVEVAPSTTMRFFLTMPS